MKMLLVVLQMCLQLGIDTAPSIKIDKITSDQQITGFVTGVTPEKAGQFKVVVYVHTDQWYIHPYANGGDGKSWASVTPTGTWRIETVAREFPADKMAALLIDRDFEAPSRTGNIESIPRKAAEVKPLKGTDDFGKL